MEPIAGPNPNSLQTTNGRDAGFAGGNGTRAAFARLAKLATAVIATFAASFVAWRNPGAQGIPVCRQFAHPSDKRLGSAKKTLARRSLSDCFGTLQLTIKLSCRPTAQRLSGQMQRMASCAYTHLGGALP